jgi:hypothetical protein
MPEAQTEQHSNGSGSGALTTAAVAAATGAAAYGVRKALSHRGGGGGGRGRRGSGDSPVSIVGSAASSAWDSASHTLVPMAEQAADAAGRWVADHAPEVVRERILPRFIDAFNEAA